MLQPNSVQCDEAEREWAECYSLFNKAIDGAVLSAVKKAEDHDTLIVRFYNAPETEVIANDRIHFSKPVTHWQEVRMDETLVDGTDKAAGELGGLLLTQTPSFMVGFWPITLNKS